jgi:hypothetical protein
VGLVEAVMAAVAEANEPQVVVGRIPEEVGSAPGEVVTSLELAVVGMVLEEEES